MLALETPQKAKTMNSNTNRGTARQALRPFIMFVPLVLVLLGLSRMGLVIWQWDRVNAVGGVGYILLQGLRFDLVALGMMLALPAILAPPRGFLPGSWHSNLGSS